MPTKAAPLADAAAPEPLEVDLGKVHDVEEPLTAARVEADFGCGHGPRPPQQLLRSKLRCGSNLLRNRPGAGAVDRVRDGDAQSEQLVADGVAFGEVFGFAGFGAVDQLLLDVGGG